MLRLFGSSSRKILSSSPSVANAFLHATRPLSNQRKLADDESTARRPPTSSTRRLNVKKLFADDDDAAGEAPSPGNPRRPNIVRASPFDDPSQMAANLPMRTRYEKDTAGMDDQQQEEQRRPARPTENKPANEGAQSKAKRTSPKKKFNNTLTIEKLFDESEYISTSKKEKRSDSPQRSEQNQQPRKPRRERALVEQTDEASSEGQPPRRSATPMLVSSIEQASSIEELLKIFDKYVVPTEFALGLQKLNQLAAAENSDAVQVYGQMDDSRQRIETLLLGFVNKLSDNEVITAIAFVTKYYPEDNDFTDKFSLSLGSRLRRIGVHQIVRILEELKSSRHTAQWIHRVYNRLLALAEGRYFEFDNVRDILALTHKLPYNDRLINRLDERVLEIGDSLSFDDWFKILINKSMLKRRDRTMIRAACYHLLKLSDSFLFPLDKTKDCLLACAMLNVYDKPFLERLVRDVYEQVNLIDDPFLLQSIITSMGALRIRHCELLESFGKLLVEDPTANAKSIQAFVRTCAAVNYAPAALPKLVDNHLQFDETDVDQLAETKNRIDLIWSLAVLDQANQSHVSMVLSQDVFQLIQNEVSNSKIASALKLLAIYSYGLQKFSKKFLKPTFNIEQLAQQLTLKNSNAQEQLAKSVTTFAPENQYSKFSVVTSNMIVIDCLMVVDKTGAPQDLSTVLTNGDSNGTTGQTTFNKVRVDENRFKVALKCLDYQDKTLISNSLSGSVALQLRLLNSLGYKCVPIHYDEFIKIQVPNDRVKYIQRKIKEAVSPAPMAGRAMSERSTPDRQ